MEKISGPLSSGSEAQNVINPVPASTFLIAQDLVVRVGEKLGGEVNEIIDRLGGLTRQMAGLEKDRTGDNARRRLQNPRLKTTLLSDTIRSHKVRALELREELVRKMMDIIEPALKLELAEANYLEAVALKAKLDSVAVEKKATGIYPAVVIAADYLHQQHNVTHWHWASAGPERLKQVAEILTKK